MSYRIKDKKIVCDCGGKITLTKRDPYINKDNKLSLRLSCDKCSKVIIRKMEKG